MEQQCIVGIDCSTYGKMRRGYCERHYKALMLHGDPTIRISNKGKPAEERFWLKIDKTAAGCWLWTGKIAARTGYGGLSVDRRMVLAHRFSYELHRGPIPEGLVIDHLCRVSRQLPSRRTSTAVRVWQRKTPPRRTASSATPSTRRTPDGILRRTVGVGPATGNGCVAPEPPGELRRAPGPRSRPAGEGPCRCEEARLTSTPPRHTASSSGSSSP